MIAYRTMWSRCVWLYTSKKKVKLELLSQQVAEFAAKNEKRAILLNVFLGKLGSIQKANTLRFTTCPKPHLLCKVS